MAKRFSDTDKWKKPFLRSLKAPYKLLWLYILDECNHAGIWDVDMEIAEIKIGEKLNIETALNSFGNRILVFDEGTKWFIYDFIDFQYGELNPENRVHNSVLSLLNKYKIDLENKPLTSPLLGAKDKDKDKDKDKEINIELPFFSKEFLEVWNLLLTENKHFKKKTAKQLQRIADDLKKHSEQEAIEAIGETFKGGWMAIHFKEKRKPIINPNQSKGMFEAAEELRRSLEEF